MSTFMPCRAGKVQGKNWANLAEMKAGGVKEGKTECGNEMSI